MQCHGCFDIVHPGHVRYLEFARRQGDLLLVSLTGDGDVSKGADRPYIPQELRAENIAALEFVDLVYIDPSPTAEALLARTRPDVYVKGSEYESSRDPRFLAERRVVESHGGRMLFSSGEVVFSSTKLIGDLCEPGASAASRTELTCSRYGIDQQTLTRRIEEFSELRVVVIGDVILDRYVHCDAVGVASEAPVVSLTQLEERTFVGGAGIVARHARALGAESVLISRTGSDVASEEVRHVLEAEGVRASFIPLPAALPQKTRFLAEESKLFKLDQVPFQPLDSLAEEELAACILREAHAAHAVIFCDFGCGLLTGGLLARVLPRLRETVRILSADVSGPRANLLHFRHVDLLCPTERELREALHDHESGLSNAAWQLMHHTHARRLIITLGKRGVVTFERPEQVAAAPGREGRLRSETLPSFAPHAVDTLGAGDAMLAAATLTLATGADLLQAAYLGSAAAALEVAALGNVPIDRDRLRAWIATRRELALAQRALHRQSVALPRNEPDAQAVPT